MQDMMCLYCRTSVTGPVLRTVHIRSSLLRPRLLRSCLLRPILIRSGLLRSSLLNLVFLGPVSSVFRLYLLRPDLLRPSFLRPVVYFSLHLSEVVHLIGRQNAYTRSLQLLTVFYSRLYATLQKQ